MREWIDTFKEIVSDHIKWRKQILQLAKSNLIKQYRGAAFGWAWAIIRPSITIFVFWFAFSIGLRHGKPVEGYPFFLWLIAGFIPWFFMKDSITSGAGSLRKYKYLVQRIKYPIDTIPTFVIISELLVNFILFCILVAIYAGFGYAPDIYYLQIPLLYLMTFVFFMGWGIFSGMLSSISKDFLNLVKSIITALFWLSGIIYNVDRIEIPLLRRIMFFNPITILVNGFRDTLIYHKWIWESPRLIRNYCLVTLLMWILAIWAYKKLKHEVADVL